MAAPKETTDRAQAPGPKVVEALQHPIAAKLTAIAVQEAHDARMRELTADGQHLTSTEAMKLELVSNLGVQLVVAMTPPGGGS